MQNSTLGDSSQESQLDTNERQQRNEQILKNVTFDHNGNPLTVLAPDLAKFANYNRIQPKYKFTDKTPELPSNTFVVEETK